MSLPRVYIFPLFFAFLGLIWAEVKQLWDDGAKTYVQDMWNILDFITNSLYIATFTLKMVAYYKVQNTAPSRFRKTNTFCYVIVPRLFSAMLKLLRRVSPISGNKNFRTLGADFCFVILIMYMYVCLFQVQDEIKQGQLVSAEAKREDWDAYDPNLIAEGLFAVANIFSTLKLIFIFTINPHLGPLQISLGRMVMDIMKFAFIAILVVFSYACGVNQLYWYYAEEKTRECTECVAKSTEENVADCECDRTLSK